MISALKVYLPTLTFSMVPLPLLSVSEYLALPFSGVRETVAKPIGSSLDASVSFTVTFTFWAIIAREANRLTRLSRILLVDIKITIYPFGGHTVQLDASRTRRFNRPM